MNYEVTYDWASGWKPCAVRARVVPSGVAGSAGPPLQKGFEVTDCAPGSWLRTGKLEVREKHLLDRTSLAFTVVPSAALTAEDILQNQGQSVLQVSCYLDMPTSPTPLAAPCPIRILLPTEIETKTERVPDDEAVLVFARVRVGIPAGRELLNSALKSISFRAQTSRLVIASGPSRKGWKVVRVTLKPGETPEAEDLVLFINAQVGSQVIPEKRVVLPFALEGKLQVQCSPQVLKVDGAASVTAYVTPIFRNQAPPEQMRTVLESLQLDLDSAAAPWLVVGSRLLSQDSASWSVTGQAPDQQPAGTLPATATLTASGKIGAEVVQETATLGLEPDTDFELCVSVGSSEVFYAKETGWQFPDLSLCLRRPGQEMGSKLNFSCTPPVLTDDQNILKFAVVKTSETPSWSVKVSLQQNIDLDAHPGTQWLEQTGLIKVTARVEQSGGERKPFDGTVTYRLRPRLELILCDAAGDPDDPQGHSYEAAEADFAPLEFAADGVDQLEVNVFACRTDLSPNDVVEADGRAYLTLHPPRFTGPGADEFDCHIAPTEKGPILLQIWSKKPYLYTPARSRRQHLTLQLKGQLTADAPPNYVREPLALEGRLLPRYVYLKLWVVPARKRGTSTAGVFVALARIGSTEPLSNANLELQIDSPEGLLALVDSPEKSVGSDGCQLWDLVYKGLNRSNLGSPIKVRCRLQEADEGVFFSINVKDNGSQLFADLNQASGSLELTNPEWEQAGTGAYWADWLIPKKCRGVVYNARNLLAPPFLDGALPEEWSKWVCGAYSERITDWLLVRRHGKRDPQMALRMNGLEVCQYTAAGFHDWCGLHLSGTEVNTDPIFIDPWWEQSWGEEAAGYGWAQQEIRMVASLTFLVLEAAPLGVFLYRCLSYCASRAAHKFLPEVALAIKQKLSQWIANLLAGKSPVSPNTVRAVVTAASLVGAYLYQRFSMGASCHGTRFDDQFNYTYHDEGELLQRLSENHLADGGAPAGLSDCERWS